jgi:hypothetical protein
MKRPKPITFCLTQKGLFRWSFLSLLFLLLPTFVFGAQVSEVHCNNLKANEWNCRVQIEGEVEENDRLLITGKIDSDHLLFGEQLLGSSGYLLDQPFSGRIFPRVYSLNPIKSQNHPSLTLVVKNLGLQTKAPQLEARIIPPDYPWRKIYGSTALTLLTLPLWLLLMLIAVRSKKTLSDGWHYPALESQWLVSFSLLVLALEQPWFRVTVPILWSHEAIEFLLLLSTPLLLWCATQVILRSRFRDPSALTYKARIRGPKGWGKWNDLALVTSFFTLFFWPISNLGLMAQAAVAVALSLHSLARFELRKAWRRSDQGGLLLYFSLFFLVLETATRALLEGESSGLPLLSPWLVLGSELYRRVRNENIRDYAQSLVKEARRKLLPLDSGQDRLLALARLLEEEWGWARVSILSVKDDEAIVLASQGTDAIDMGQWFQPRKLGPLVKRVCRERRRIYAPMAEELNGEFSDSGMKHSSLALPLSRKGSVRVVVCLMAEDNQRIPPWEAQALDMFTKNLSLEILSAVAQDEAELRASRYLSLAREKDGLSVEALNQWGLSGLTGEGEYRQAIGSLCWPATSDSALGRRLFHQRSKDLWVLWHAHALAFEFIPLEQSAGYLALAPRKFSDKQLASLGPEGVASLCLQQFSRAVHQWMLRPGNLVLPRLVWTSHSAPLPLKPRKSGLGVEIQEMELKRFLTELKQEELRPSHGRELKVGASSSFLPKKDLRRLEQKALELERLVRSASRSAA